jgi:hypothetical protein
LPDFGAKFLGAKKTKSWHSHIAQPEEKMEQNGQLATPRINGALLGSYVNVTVRLVGRVASQQQLSVVLAASDGVNVTVKRSPTTASIYSSHTFVEVLGVVQPDHSIQEIAATGFDASFGTPSPPFQFACSGMCPFSFPLRLPDLANYDQLVKFSHTDPISTIFGIGA